MKPPGLRLEGAGARAHEACADLIMLQNPDGSLSVGLPPGAMLPLPPSSPRESSERVSDTELSADTRVNFKRHERCFSALLLAELIVDILFNLLLLRVARQSVEEVSSLYKDIPRATVWSIFWGLYACEVSYLKVYYGIGFMALVKNRSHIYSWFATVAVAGIVVQVTFAYMSKFNLLIFLMRLSSYVYAKFMRIQLQRDPLQVEGRTWS